MRPASSTNSRPLRLLYTAGPGDVIGTYGHWKQGNDDPSQVAMTYSGQFFDVCRELGAEGYVISLNPRRGIVRDGKFIIEHRPAALQNASGLLFHIGLIWYGLRLVMTAIRFGADVAVISSGTAHWTSLRLLRLFGIRPVPTVHCVLWRKNHPPGGWRRAVMKLDYRFFTKSATVTLSASHDITHQIEQITDGRNRPILHFLPTYRAGVFDGRDQPPPAGPVFRVFFAGRIERNKGVFDLLDIAKRFLAEGRTNIEFDLWGTGSQLDALKAQAESAGVSPRFRCHGHSNRPMMREMFRQCHAVIVPTTSDFIEGFNQVVAEGVLAGRPVITSSVCPALEYVRAGVVEVPPDDAIAYGDAILKLADDVSLYESKRQGCIASQSQFYDPAQGWGNALKQAIEAAR